MLGVAPCELYTMVNFLVVRTATPYNAILGRPTIVKHRLVVSPSHMKIKFATENGIGVIKAS